MTVTIRPDDGEPDSLKALLAAVSKHSGDEEVRVSHGGVTVSAAAAKKFFNSRPADAPTAGRTLDNTRAPLATVRADGSVVGAPADADVSIGGRTPEGEFPGGYEGETPAPATVRPQAPSAREQAEASAAEGDLTGRALLEGNEDESTPRRSTTQARVVSAQQQADEAAAEGDQTGRVLLGEDPAPASDADPAPAKKSTPAKKTAAAQQRATRTTRSNP